MLTKYLGLPENYSEHGGQVDQQNEFVHWLMLVLFVGWTIFFLYTLFRFWHRRNPKAEYSGVKNHASSHLEIGVVIVEAIFLLGFAFPLWAERADAKSFSDVLRREPNATRVRVVGEQYAWRYQYPGKDGVFGRTSPHFIGDANPLGLDPNDPNGYDDFLGSSLKLPVNRSAIVKLGSKDVIHNFAIKPMRIQQDCIPGKDIPIWFKPVKIMESSVVCAQLCGEGHANMLGYIEVIDANEFDEWAEAQSKASLDKRKATAAN